MKVRRLTCHRDDPVSGLLGGITFHAPPLPSASLADWKRGSYEAGKL